MGAFGHRRHPADPILSSWTLLCRCLRCSAWPTANGSCAPKWAPRFLPVDVVAVVGAQTDIRRDPESAAAEAASAQVISSMRDSAQVTSSGAINSMIAAMSTRPNRQNRSTRFLMSVPIALAPPPPCEPVHMRCAPMRRTRAHCAANPISAGQAGG